MSNRASKRRTGTSLLVIVLAVVAAWLVRGRDQPTPHVETTPPRAEARPAPAHPEPAAAPRERGTTVDRHDLAADEARGGHTLARHVGKSDAELRDRLASEGISTASTYSSREVAERTVGRALRDNADRVENWTSRRGNRPNLEIDYRGTRDDVLGRCMRRGREAADCVNAVIVLRWSGGGYYVLTSYPEPSR